MRTLPLDLLRTFVTVAETGSVTRAARQLGRSQPAASLQMKRLEDAVGAELLHRDGRQMTLTGAGDTLIGYARQMLHLNDEALGRLAQPTLAGHVRVGTPNDFAITFLPRILGRFAERHPQVSLEVSCGLSARLLDDFAAGTSGFDMVLAMQDGEGPGRVAARPLRSWQEELVWVGMPGAAAAGRRPVPLVVYPEGCVYRRTLTRALDAAGLPWRVVYCSESLAGLQAAVMSGLGLTVLARSTVPPGFAALDGEDTDLPPLPEVAISLYRRKGRLRPAALRLAAFIGESLDEGR